MSAGLVPVMTSPHLAIRRIRATSTDAPASDSRIFRRGVSEYCGTRARLVNIGNYYRQLVL
jgi:hypothetical protein